MAAAALELGLSNLAVATALAVFALAAGWWGKRPALTHALWLLVILKLVTPAVIDLPVRILPAEPVAPRPAPAAAAPARAPEPLVLAASAGAPAGLPVVDFAGPPTAPAPVRSPRMVNDVDAPPVPVTDAKPVEMPASIPLFTVAPAASPDLAPAPSAQTPDPLPAVGPEPTARPTPARFPWAELVLAVWAGGAVAWLGLVASRVRRFARALRFADDAPAWLVREVAEMADVLGLRTVPRVRLVPGAVTPMVWSLGRTAVYFPTDLLARLSPQQRAALIAHELAHLKRGDHRVRWLELAPLALYWWCPLAWLARRELRRAEEECCDAWVVAALPAGGRAYATALLDTLDFLAEAPRAPALASGMGAVAAVKRRLLLILDGRTPKRLPVVGRLLVALAAMVLLPVAPKLARLAGAAPAADAPPTAPAPKAVAPPASANPRGEALLFEPNSTEVRPGGVNWWSVSVSPNGKTVATAQGDSSSEGEVKLWDRETGKVRHTIHAPKGVRAVAFSPDGKVLATANYDATVRFYDAATFALRATGDEASGGHKVAVNGLCFFKAGKYLATAGLDNTVRVWDVAAAVAAAKPDAPARVPPVAVFEGHTQGVLSVAASADGLTLLSGSFDRTARAWDVPDPLPKMGAPPAVVKKERVLLQGHNNTVEAVAVSPDGQLLATGSWDAQLLVRDRDGKKVVFSGRFQRGVMCAAFSPDGKFLAAGSSGGVEGPPGEVRVWDVATRAETAYRGDYPGGVLGVAFTPDGTTVASVGKDRSLHLWPHADPKELRTYTPPGVTFVPQSFHAAAVSPSGEFLAVSGEGKSVYVLDRRGKKVAAELAGHADVVAGLAFSPDGKTLATASYDKTVKLWDTATWTDRRTLRGHTGWVHGVAFSPDGARLATGSYDKTIRLWDAATGEPRGTWQDHSAGVRSVAFSPDGKQLVSGGSDRIGRVWDVAGGTVVRRLKGHKGAVRAVEFAPDGKTVASGSEDRTVKLWDAATGAEVREFSGFPDMVSALRFSPKGQTLAAGTFQGPVVVLDPATGRKRQTLAGHNDAVSAVVFADDGRVLLTASADRTIRQWAAVPPAAGAARVLATPTGVVAAVAVTPNGRTAVLGGVDGSLAVWDLAGGQRRPLLTSPAGSEPVEQVAASARFAAAADRGGKVRVVPLDGSAPTWAGASGRFAAFTPDGKHLAVADGKDVVLYDPATEAEVRRFAAGHDGAVVRVAFSPDGKLLASAGEDTKVRLWDAATGAKRQETPAFGNYSAITQLAFSPDGTRLAVAAYGPESPPPDDMTGNFQVIRQVRVYAVPAPGAAGFAGNPITFSPQPSDQPITGLEWTPTGQALISPAADGTVRLTELRGTAANEVQRFRAHEAAVLACAVAPDAREFLTAGEDMAVKRWPLPGTDLAAGAARLTAPGLTRVWEAIPSPDGRYLVTAGEGDRAFRVYTALSSSVPVEPDRHPAVMAMAYSPDGKVLVTGHDKGIVVVREAATGKPVRTLTGLAKRVSSVAFAEGGAALVAVGGNWSNGEEAGEAVVWDFPAGTVRHKLDAPVLQWMVAVHPNGKTAAGAGNDGEVRVWDLATGKLTKTLTKGRPGLLSVAFDATGDRLVTGNATGTVRVWDVASGTVRREFVLANNLRTSRALFSPDGREVVVSGWWGGGPNQTPPTIAAFTIDRPEAPPRQFPAHPVSVMSLAFLPDGKTLVAAGGEAAGGSLRVYDFATGKQFGQLVGHTHWAQNLAVSPDGSAVASTSWANPAAGEFRLWAAGGFRPAAEVPVPGEKSYISSGAIGRGGKLLVLCGWGQTLTAWDMTDPARPVLKKALKGHTAALRSVAFDAAGARFVTTDEGGTVKVWDAATLTQIVSFRASERAVYRAKFTPDGKELVTCAGNYREPVPAELRVWDPKTGTEAGRFAVQARAVWDVVFLDGGKTMVTAQALNGEPGSAPIKVWDYAARKEVRSVGVLGSMRCLAVSPDGKYLAAGNHSGQWRVIDTANWEAVLTPPTHAQVIFRLAFSPDGKSLIAAGGDGAAGVVGLPRAK